MRSFDPEIWTLESNDPETERIVRTLAELNSLRADLVAGHMWGLTRAGRTPIMGSRLGRGEELPAMLAAYYATFNQEGGPLPNGFSQFEAVTDPSIEHLGCISMALNEALVQSVSATPGVDHEAWLWGLRFRAEPNRCTKVTEPQRLSSYPWARA